MTGSANVPLGNRRGMNITSGKKRASLFTWLTLQSIQEETVISPSILDFLEQALEPIPLPDPKQSHENSSPPINSQPDSPVFNIDDMDPSAVTNTGGSIAYSSFPVDVIVYFHMQPSTIRYNIFCNM